MVPVGYSVFISVGFILAERPAVERYELYFRRFYRKLRLCLGQDKVVGNAVRIALARRIYRADGIYDLVSAYGQCVEFARNFVGAFVNFIIRGIDPEIRVVAVVRRTAQGYGAVIKFAFCQRNAETAEFFLGYFYLYLLIVVRFVRPDVIVSAGTVFFKRDRNGIFACEFKPFDFRAVQRDADRLNHLVSAFAGNKPVVMYKCGKIECFSVVLLSTA